MNCLEPQSIPRPNGKGRTDRITVGCNKCLPCLEKRQRDWTFRLQQEMRTVQSAYFLTMTYTDQSIPWSRDGIQTLRKKDYQNFIKLIRDKQTQIIDKWDKLPFYVESKENAKKQQIRYYGVGEYGTKTERPHYHMLIFNLLPETKDQLQNIWKHGFIKIGTVTSKSIAYVTKYVINQNAQDHVGRLEPFSTMSLKPPIGYGYLINAPMHKISMSQNVLNDNGKFQSMPRYYKDKLWDKRQLEMISLEQRAREDARIMEEDDKFEAKDINPYKYRIELQEQKLNRKRNYLNKKNTF